MSPALRGRPAHASVRGVSPSSLLRGCLILLAWWSLAGVAGCVPNPLSDAGTGGPAPDAAVVVADAGVPRAEGSACDPETPRCRLGLFCAVDIRAPLDGGAGTCRAPCVPAAPECPPDRGCVPLGGRDAGACMPVDGGLP
jgi:hypothetical protein